MASPISPRCIELRQKAGAFSLVEVVLALGIVSFALVTLLGIVPTGMKVNRESREDYQAQEILRQIVFELRETDSGVASQSRFGIPTVLAENQPASIILSEQGAVCTGVTDPKAKYILTYTLHGTTTTQTVKPWLHLKLAWPVTGTNPQTAELGMPYENP